MKVTVKQSDVVERKSYPYLGINENAVVVAFTCEKTGVVMANNDTVLNGFSLFEYRSDWIESTFRVFEGEIVLRN